MKSHHRKRRSAPHKASDIKIDSQAVAEMIENKGLITHEQNHLSVITIASIPAIKRQPDKVMTDLTHDRNGEVIQSSTAMVANWPKMNKNAKFNILHDVKLELMEMSCSSHSESEETE